MTTLAEVQKEDRIPREIDSHGECGVLCIEAMVERSIRSQTGGLIRGLKIESYGDQLVVYGSADLFYHKQLATRAAMEVSREIVLLNKIEVCPN